MKEKSQKGEHETRRPEGFMAAFRNRSMRRVELSRFRNGDPAPYHVIDGLPRDWAKAVDEDGTVLALRPEVEAGYLYRGHFYTRREAERIARTVH